MNKYRKGRDFELQLAKDLRESGLDKRAGRMPRSGSIYTLEEDIRTDLPIHIEAKNQKTWDIHGWYKQAAEAKKKTKIAIVVAKREQDDTYAFLRWQDLLELMSYAKQGGWTEPLAFSKAAQLGKTK